MAESNGNGVRVTNREIFDEVRTVHTKVDRMDERLKVVERHENRISAVEKKVWAIPSLATVIALVSLVLKLSGSPETSMSAQAVNQEVVASKVLATASTATTTPTTTPAVVTVDTTDKDEPIAQVPDPENVMDILARIVPGLAAAPDLPVVGQVTR